MDRMPGVYWVAAAFFLLQIALVPVVAQTDSEIDVKTLASGIEKRLQACPRREVVAQFDRKHHKQVWQKQAWGPPTDVFADVRPNDSGSVLYPYVLVVEFSLKTAFGPERDNKADAERDSDLSPFGRRT